MYQPVTKVSKVDETYDATIKGYKYEAKPVSKAAAEGKPLLESENTNEVYDEYIKKDKYTLPRGDDDDPDELLRKAEDYIDRLMKRNETLQGIADRMLVKNRDLHKDLDDCNKGIVTPKEKELESELLKVRDQYIVLKEEMEQLQKVNESLEQQLEGKRRKQPQKIRVAAAEEF